MKITALVVDDEALDRELLTRLIAQYCGSIIVVAEASNIQEAIREINIHQPEVVFLDINMPQSGGFSLVQNFPNRNFQIIFTTGSEEHGIRAIKAEATDYLVKPIDVDELIASEQKLLKHRRLPERFPSLLRVFHNGEHIMVNARDIICMEAEGSYVKIYLTGQQTLLLSKNLKQITMEVSHPDLKRVHRSYVVNIQHIRRYQVTGNELKIFLSNDVVARASRKYKAQLKGTVL
ncbi:LytR/AlgR family response regulator transcription factor [Pseudochryseolinea flava]|uniref:DNA-binding response regulator n=1 Tax=Pseudochryseolinea flava TaxID=2059302 RepID=A0A364XX83_9BACT|nr:LytTR family DNA-binding domain-containing protein [Pseudochryseolinea flava]RAV98865.1 hypothetical protein DQQ10_21415 [Pseudochryseolinea flava]